jgi:hypothetical protein
MQQPEPATSFTTHLNHGEDVAMFVADCLAQEPESAWVEAFGVVEAPVVQQLVDGIRQERSLQGAWDLVHLRACLAVSQWGTVLLARGGSSNSETVAGLLLKATAKDVSCRVLSAASVAATPRQTPVSPPIEVTASAPIQMSNSSPIITPPPVRQPEPEAEVREEVRALREPEDDANKAKASYPGGAVVPPKRGKKDGWLDETYPEEGDRVNHFTFGPCTVVGSDGERIRLQQDRDSRVREVALGMLKISEPTMDAEGVRHWDLARKN